MILKASNPGNISSIQPNINRKTDADIVFNLVIVGYEYFG
jgi:hypothetical protein